RGLAPMPIFVTGLKEAEAIAFIEQAVADFEPAAIIATTAFASGSDDQGKTLFDRTEVPVFQVVIATTRREGWAEGKRGLNPADLAMHVVQPELDDRILSGAISSKTGRNSASLVNQPEPDRVQQVAERIAAFLRMKMTPRAERRIAILLPDYPSAPGR